MSAQCKDVWCTDPHESTGQATPTLEGCSWRPVFGVSGFCCRKVSVNQVIKHRQVKQLVAALRVSLLPTLLMPETEKNLSWLMLLRKASKMCFILVPSSLLTCLHPSSSNSKVPMQVSHYPELSSSQARSSLAPSPWLQVLPVLMKWSKPTFSEWVSPHSVTLSNVHGTHLSGRSFTVQCRDMPSKTQRVNAV